MGNQVEFYIQTEGGGLSAEGAVADAIGKSPELPFEEGAIIEVHVESAWTDSEGHHHAKVSAVKFVDPIVKAHKKNPNKKFDDAEAAREYAEKDDRDPAEQNEGDTVDPAVVEMHRMREVQEADDKQITLNSRHAEAPEPDVDNSPEAIFGSLHQDPDEIEKREIHTKPDRDVHVDEVHIPHDDITRPETDTETFDLPHDMQLAEDEFEDDFEHAVHDIGDEKRRKKELEYAAEHTQDTSLPAPQPGGTEEQKTS